MRLPATKLVEVFCMVRARGLEPPILAEPDPKSGVSAIPPRAQPLFTSLRILVSLQLDVCHFKGNATPFDGPKATKREKPVFSKQSYAPESYQKVLDGCKRPVCGARFYAPPALQPPSFQTPTSRMSRSLPVMDFSGGWNSTTGFKISKLDRDFA
jgi:hypothetical protein